MTPPLLEVRDLVVSFPTPDGLVKAVRGVDIEVEAGEVVGVVGESGSGKSVTMMAVMGLLPKTAQVSGSVKYDGKELLGLPAKEMRAYRGSEIAMIFQDPMTSLNPVFTVGAQIIEAIEVHRRRSGEKPDKGHLRDRAIEMLELVGIPQPAKRVDSYPHEFSGGMRQRAMIAMAMANSPNLLIADEPTTALDVTIQAQILEVIENVRRERNVGIALITHDLGVIAGVADRVNVMYAGEIMERGRVDDVFYRSRNPYTRGLLASLPRVDATEREELTPIRGVPPSLIRLPNGCAFNPRCPHAQAICVEANPPLRRVEVVDTACHFAEDLPALDSETEEASR